MTEIGVVLPTRVGLGAVPPDTLLEIAEAVDRTDGWSHIWVTDSIISLPFYDSTVLLAAAAARTSRVRLGVACQASLGLRHPLIAAQQWANLDALSGGRMTLIACPGEATGPTRVKELRAFGMSHAEKVRQMEETIEFLRTVSRGGSVSFAGRHFSIDDLELAPAFVQQPFPIWMTGNPPEDASEELVARVLSRVARLGDGWLTFAVTPEVLAARTDTLSGLRVSAGRSPDGEFPVVVFLNVNVNPVGEQAVTDATAAWRRQSTRNVSSDDLKKVAAIGSPEEVADFIGRLSDAGATAIAVNLLSSDHRTQLDMISEYLLPLVA